jgi:hypothetical protein
VNNRVDKKETFVSAVLVLGESDEKSFEDYLKELQCYLALRYSDYEIIIIDQDGYHIADARRKALLDNIPSIRWLNLSFRVGMDVALCAGVENAIGDFVILLRPTIEPIDIIGDMVEQCAHGYDVVIGIAKRPRTLGYKVARMISNKILQSIGYHIPKNSTPVRCLSRRAINTILRTGQLNHQFLIRVANAGYPAKEYRYKLLNQEILNKQTLFSGIKQTLNLMIFNSTKPLRWISLLGVLGSFSAFIFALYSIVVNFIKEDVIEGWTSMVFFSSFLFMILFVILAFLGEYLARLLSENNNQKTYYISSEETSAVMLEEDRFNVLQQS